MVPLCGAWAALSDPSLVFHARNRSVKHAVHDLGLMAMCTRRKTVVFALRPKISVVRKIKHPPMATPGLSFAAWRPAIRSEASSSIIDPILVLAVGNEITMFQVCR